jgi:hypothetical protein
MTNDDFEPRVNLPPQDATLPETHNVDVNIMAHQGSVVVAFAQPVTVLRLDPKTARALAEALRQRSHEAEKEKL